jgi:hypothetical protein
LIDVFGKDEQADLTVGQKKALRGVADIPKHAAIQAAGTLQRGKS